MITFIEWIPRGAPQSIPIQNEMENPIFPQEFSKMDLKLNENLNENENENLNENLNENENENEIEINENEIENLNENEINEIEINENDDDDDDDGILNQFATRIGDLMYYNNPQDDPNLVQNDDDDSEKDDLIIKNTDLLAIAAKSEEEMSSLEIYLYEEKQDNFYVHHDIILPTFPLSLAWLNSAPDSYLKERSIESGNFVAVGTFDPTIEIWDLDILDAEAPIAMLGGLSEKPRKRRVKKKTGRNRGMRFEIEPILKYKPESHTDSVLGLSWNKLHHNLLSSGSADKTVKIWEIPTQQCLHTLSHHSNKVQSVSWNPKNDSLLLTAGYDSAAFICDIKQNLTKNQGITKFSLSSEVEYCAWNPIESDKFIVSTDDGIVQYYDIRNHSSPIFSANCHKKETTSISFSLIPGLLVTAGTDKSIKIWDLQGNQLTFIYAKEFPEIGKIFSVKFSDDSPFVVSFGGSQGKVSFWDLTTLKQVQDRFISRIPQMNSSKKK
ncbi:periodic tryptophan protein [Anaeramoeba ignava]|uniref:Periodic tryptophan protein n=1 Tax=Anaeramoeba ignava TaxID=1746090 RepID=A0A9Q0R687_ANAIG|nr:periodic tryptophan protein [Anaeramoeba ignava]